MKRSLGAACVALLAGCSGINTACTLVACDSGLTVQLAQTPVGAYRIEAFSGVGSGAHYVYDCANAAQCGPAAFFTDYTPETVTIRVTTSAGTREQTAQPTYNVERPNGPNCEPVCRQGVVTVALPG